MPEFASRLLDWFDRAGRHDLPWQHPRTAYRVWLSEVMLQQTQVATVIPYFSRFVEALPDLRALAAAPADQVLALWSGLGYYSRARNLHRAAQLCVERHDGHLPDEVDELRALPGIGRSTAGAILSLAFNNPAPILDGNVRRVLIRHSGIEGDPLSPVVQKQLWAISGDLLPTVRVADYTQAIMDLGATVCVRAQPRCPACPLRADCLAATSGRTAQLPSPRKRPARTRRDSHALILRDRTGRFLLERRPAAGVWGGLWSIPEFPDQSTLESSLSSRFAPAAMESNALPAITHAFTHFDLTLRPTLFDLGAATCAISELDSPRWFAPNELGGIGLPSPIRKLLTRLPELSDAS